MSSEFTNRAARRAQRRGAGGKDLVRNAQGKPLLCCWDDCEETGDDRVKEIIEDGFEAKGGPPKRLHYIFCSDRHRAFWRNSHVDNGNLPTGSKGLLT